MTISNTSACSAAIKFIFYTARFGGFPYPVSFNGYPYMINGILSYSVVYSVVIVAIRKSLFVLARMTDIPALSAAILSQVIPSESIDMILCDLPYGMTQNKRDSYIPLPQLWNEYMRIIKPNGVIALTSAGVFTAKLILSNEEFYRYK